MAFVHVAARAAVPLADPLGRGAGRQVHAQLAAAQPAVEDVLGVFLRLDDGVRAAVLPSSRCSRMPHFCMRMILTISSRDAALLDLGDVDVAAAGRLGPLRQRADDPADVDVLQVAVFADEVEDEPAALLVAQPPQSPVVRSPRPARRPDRRSVPLLDPPAGQPLDLHEELGARAPAAIPRRSLFSSSPIRAAYIRLRHSRLADVVLAELGRDGLAEFLAAGLRRPPAGSRPSRAAKSYGGEIGLREALAGHEEGDLRVARGG